MDDNNPNRVSADTLELYAKTTIEKETAELTRLCSIVSDSIKIDLVNGSIVSESQLTSSELELLAMRIPAECLRIQAALNRYTAQNVFKDITIEARITEHISTLIGSKGNADERKRKAELLELDERTISLTNKTIVKGLQAYIERADKVYEGIKKVMDYRSKEMWFDRKNTG